MAGKTDNARKLTGPVAVIECTEDIPCDPCATCCTRKAITFEGSINSIPRLEESKCNGCGICVAKCPGMAIFVVDESFSEEEGLVSFPHEFLPMPKTGDGVWAADRSGSAVCEGIVHKVINPKNFDGTAVVTVRVPRQYLSEVRGIR